MLLFFFVQYWLPKLEFSQWREWSSLWDPVQLKQRRKLLSQEIQEKKNNTGMVQYVQDSCINGFTETGLAWNSLLNWGQTILHFWFTCLSLLISEITDEFCFVFSLLRHRTTLNPRLPGTHCYSLIGPPSATEATTFNIGSYFYGEYIFLEGVEMLMGGKGWYLREITIFMPLKKYTTHRCIRNASGLSVRTANDLNPWATLPGPEVWNFLKKDLISTDTAQFYTIK